MCVTMSCKVDLLGGCKCCEFQEDLVMRFSLDSTIIWISNLPAKKMHRFRRFYWKIRFRRTYSVKWQVVSNSGAWKFEFWCLQRHLGYICAAFMIHEGSLGPPISWWGMSHAHALHDQPPWSRLAAAKLRTNLVVVPIPGPFIFIHQCAPVASLLIVCAALCTGPQQSTPKKKAAHLRHYSLSKLTFSLFLPHLHPWLLGTWWQKPFTVIASAWGSPAEMGQAWVRGTTRQGATLAPRSAGHTCF